MITSRQNQHVKAARALLSSVKKRREAGRFVLEGLRLAEEALAANWPLERALYAPDLPARGQALLDQLAHRQVPAEECHPDILASLSDTPSPQGLILIARAQSLPAPAKPQFVLILDALSDPGNLGSLLRSARAAGVDAVWLAPDCADPLAPKVLRAAMGAHFRLPLFPMDWPQIAQEAAAHRLKLFLSDVATGTNYRSADYAAPLALIIGSEAHGAGEAARSLEHQAIHIPMRADSESLNAAAAGAVLLFEIAAQKSAA